MNKRKLGVGKSRWNKLLSKIEKDGLRYKLGYGARFDGRAGVDAKLLNADGLYWGGCAYCSDKDQFNKKLGRLIALGRAYKKFKEVGIEGGLVDLEVTKDGNTNQE